MEDFEIKMFYKNKNYQVTSEYSKLTTVTIFDQDLNR